MMNICAGESIYRKYGVGDIITFPHKTLGDIDFIVIGKNRDASDSITIMTKNIIKLSPFDASEKTIDNTNTDRCIYGNNRYIMSNLLAWLNSSGKVCWYKRKHPMDDKPTMENIFDGINPYDKIPGFLSGFDKEFVNSIIPVTKRTALPIGRDISNVHVENSPARTREELIDMYENEVDYSELEKDPTVDMDVIRYLDSILEVKHPNDYDEVTSRVFLLSRSEIGFGSEYGIMEGLEYEWFESIYHTEKYMNRKRKCKPSKVAIDIGRYDSSKLCEEYELSEDDGWYWWLRTPDILSDYSTRVVSVDGTLSTMKAYDGRVGIRPACVIR